MGANDTTRRVQFTLPASLVDAIDAYCEKVHMSRATFVEYTLASSINTAQALIDGVAQHMSEQALKEGADA